MRKFLTLLALLSACNLVHAQEPPDMTFTAQTTVGVEQVTPVLSWSTNPLANSCTAFGSRSGEKGGDGSETREPITEGATYVLTCSWLSLGSATVSWTPPIENTDDSPLTDLSGYKVYWGTSAGQYTEDISIDNPGVTTYIIEQLPPAEYFFVSTALNEIGIESDLSNEVSKTIPGIADQERSVSITVNAKPKPNTGMSVQVN